MSIKLNKESIFFTLTVSFIITIVLIIVSFFILISQNYEYQEGQLIRKYSPIIKMIHRQIRFNHINKDFEKFLRDDNYMIVKDLGKINSIIYNPKTKILTQRVRNTHRKSADIFRVLCLNDVNYIYLKKRDKGILIKDLNTSNSSTGLYIFLVFAIILIATVLVYILTLKKLLPLKMLQEKVKNLGDENFDFKCCNSDAKDEVSQLGHEFMQTAKKLKDIKEARNIFIRNIMHELKTPITKGKFLTQLEQNEINNEKLKSVFNRLESLINEFASIEELISSSKDIEKKHYFLDDIVDNAKDILMLDDELVVSKYSNIKLEVNYKLFSIAIKNLLDNAIKYSPDKRVTINTEGENIIIKNQGKALDFPLENYFEPFFSNEDKSKNSFGLGLYIVHHILRANSYELNYEYLKGENRFICKKMV